jgi:hypothetical protein
VCEGGEVATPIEFRRLARAELTRVAEIDRTERIDVIYEQHGTELVERRGNWSSPAWTPMGTASTRSMRSGTPSSTTSTRAGPQSAPSPTES